MRLRRAHDATARPHIIVPQYAFFQVSREFELAHSLPKGLSFITTPPSEAPLACRCAEILIYIVTHIMLRILAVSPLHYFSPLYAAAISSILHVNTYLAPDVSPPPHIAENRWDIFHYVAFDTADRDYFITPWMPSLRQLPRRMLPTALGDSLLLRLPRAHFELFHFISRYVMILRFWYTP